MTALCDFSHLHTLSRYSQCLKPIGFVEPARACGCNRDTCGGVCSQETLERVVAGYKPAPQEVDDTESFMVALGSAANLPGARNSVMDFHAEEEEPHCFSLSEGNALISYLAQCAHR